ncbi:transcriptional regulatory protein [Diplodia corticola]|uniref:Transcriptional regulatory protein n=1 Tax=Diplodia corticola TaxID=236234 RepID=A0A1J9RN58_9PEZI|nr:transcriptional regulatory protein [Diplodia corticola]OJD29037.1 transcriptional regulatory protein [Diplodia corticola]
MTLTTMAPNSVMVRDRPARRVEAMVRHASTKAPSKTTPIRDVEELRDRVDPACAVSTHLRSLAPAADAASDSTETVTFEPEAVPHKTASQEEPQSRPGEAAVDTLATEAFDVMPVREIGYFGPTSNHALFRSLSNIFAQTTSLRNHTATLSRSTDGGNNFNPSDHGQIRSERRNAHPPSLPGHRELMGLINHFSHKVSGVFPFITISSVIEGIDQNGPRKSRALLNIVCAHASTSMQCENAELFYRRALALLDERNLRGSSLELIQTLLLLSSYQQNNQRAVASWTYHALAVKAAYQLGLHSLRCHTDFNSPQTEQRQRLWNAVINEDRYLSIALGRPFLIPSQHVRVPKRSVPSVPSPASSAETSSITFFNHLTSLYAIQGNVVESMYDHNLEPEADLGLEDLIVERLKLVVKLEQWRQSVSPFCDVLSEGLDAKLLDSKRYETMLCIQYYRTVLLINGPILMGVLEHSIAKRDAENITFIQEQVLPPIKSSFSAALQLQQIISNVNRCGNAFINGNAMWWACNYTSFTVVLHLFGAFLACERPGVEMAFDGRRRLELRSALDSALETLNAIKRTSIMSRKARQCIANFLDIYDALDSDQQTSNTADISHTLNMPDETTLPIDDTAADSLYAFINQAADEFLFQCSDSSYLDADFSFF